MDVIYILLSLAAIVLLVKFIKMFNCYLIEKYQISLYEYKNLFLIGIIEIIVLFGYLYKEDLAIDNFLMLMIIAIILVIYVLVPIIRRTNIFIGIIVFIIDSAIITTIFIYVVFIINAILGRKERNG